MASDADPATLGADRRVFVLAAAATVVLDLVTKLIAEATLLRTPGVSVFGDWFQLRLVYNQGAAFGLHVGPYSRWIFFTVALVAVFVLDGNREDAYFLTADARVAEARPRPAPGGGECVAVGWKLSDIRQRAVRVSARVDDLDKVPAAESQRSADIQDALSASRHLEMRRRPVLNLLSPALKGTVDLSPQLVADDEEDDQRSGQDRECDRRGGDEGQTGAKTHGSRSA